LEEIQEWQKKIYDGGTPLLAELASYKRAKDQVCRLVHQKPYAFLGEERKAAGTYSEGRSWPQGISGIRGRPSRARKESN